MGVGKRPLTLPYISEKVVLGRTFAEKNGGPEEIVPFSPGNGWPCSASGHTVLKTGPAVFYRQYRIGVITF
jgi:hypothetical protein